MSSSTISIPDLISKKEQGKTLSKDEIEYFVECVTKFERMRGQNAQNVENPSITEAEIDKMLKAIYDKHLNDDETEHLTSAMIRSGEILEWPPEWKGILVDKHSTGGVGDKTSLVLAPVLAACGLKVPMISGRGLEHTGGTLDKLESIPGFKVKRSTDEMKKVVANVGCCIVGQTKDLVPADKILYERRDITKTVREFGLITASIISKKAAESINVLVLDVKYGKGAFYEQLDDARTLALKMVKAGHGNGVETTALLTDMNSPLGYQIGNALEVAESIECLKGRGPQDLKDLVKELGGQLLESVKNCSKADAHSQIDGTLQDGSALAKFIEMIKAQGVDADTAEKLRCSKNESDTFDILQPQSNRQCKELTASTTGFVHSINAKTCGIVSAKLGGNRIKKGDVILFDVGLTLSVKVGDRIEEGSTWVTMHHRKELSSDIIEELEGAIEIKPDEITPIRSRVADIVKQKM